MTMEGVSGAARTARWTSHTADQTERAGMGLAPFLEVGDVLVLSGPLGAGKTRLVAGIARGLGCTGETRSPSFTLVNELRGRLILAHVDLYRVETVEADSLGLDEYLERGALAVEWGEKLPDPLLVQALRLEFETLPGDERMISAETDAPRGRGAELLEQWRRVAGEVLSTPAPEGPGGSPPARRDRAQ